MEIKIEEVEKAAREQGWRVGRTTKGHPIFFPPDKSQPAIVWSGTPSDAHSYPNALARMKRAGFRWPWRKK